MAFDDIKDKGLLSNKGADLLRTRQERIQTKSVSEVRILEKIAQDNAEIAKITKNLNSNFEENLVNITALSNRVEALKKVAQQQEHGRIYGAGKAFTQSAMTLTGTAATSSDISQIARSSSSLGAAAALAYRTPTSDLEDSILRSKSMLTKQTERIRDTAGNIEGNEWRFSQQMNTRNSLIMQIGHAQAALSMQRKLGIDTQSQYYRAAELSESVRGEQERENISRGVMSGRINNRQQVEEQLENVGKKLIQTFEQLDAAIKSGSKEANHLTKEFDSLAKEYKINKVTLSEMNRQNIPSSMSVAAGIIGNVGTIAQGGAQAYRYIGVTSELAQGQNRIGLANMANQRFQDVYGASQGDMSTLRRVINNQYAEQVKRGFLLAGREDAAALIETAGTGARAVGTGIDAATGPSGIWAGIKGMFSGGPVGAAAGVATQGLAAATPDAVAFAKNMTDYSKQITQTQTFIQAQQQTRALQDAISQISDFSSQSTHDYLRDVTTSTRGLGVGSVGAGYYGAVHRVGFGGTGALGSEMPGADIGPTDWGGARNFIKRHEGFSGRAYRDTSKGYSVGYGSFVPGTGQRGRNITRAEADALFNKDFEAHKAGADSILGEDVLSRLNENQRSALYSLSYNAGPGALKYGKNASIVERLKRGDISGAGEAILNTAITSDGTVNPAIVRRRQDEHDMFFSVDRAAGGRTTGGGWKTTGIRGGGDRQSLQELLTDPTIVSMIANQAGLGTKDISRLSSMAVSGLGKEFSRDFGMGGVNDLVRAGQLSRIGYMQSPEQYFQARSMMTGAGGGAQDLEETLKNAVANGMDSSKNIMEMVQATSSLAQRSAALGINAYSGAAEGMSRSVDALRGAGVSANMATAAAQRAAAGAEDVAGSRDLDISNVIETARLRNSFGGASLQQLESMRTASPMQLSRLRQLYKTGKTKEAEDMTIQMGLYGQVKGVADVEKIQDATREQVIRRSTGFGIDRVKEESIQEKMRLGQTLTKDERSFMAGMATLNMGVSGDALRGYMDFKSAPKSKALATAPGGIVASGEDTMRAGATSDARIFADGVNNFQKAIGGLESLGQTMMKISESVKPDEYAKATKDAAMELKIPVSAFGTSVKELNNAIMELSKMLKGMANGKSGPVMDLLKNYNPTQTRKQ